MSEIFRSSLFLLVLLNPFLVIVYLIDALQKLSRQRFQFVIIRAGMISFIFFCLFAILGDSIFRDIVQANFASFQIFGGVVFLLIALQFVFKGGSAIKSLRGESKHIIGSIVMPVLIGPGTISYSIIIGKKHEPLVAFLAIFIAIFVTVSVMIILKLVYDYIQERNAELIQRYFEVAGRILALIVGTISVEMIMLGIQQWVTIINSG